MDLRTAKLAALEVLRSCGAFRIAASLPYRKSRLVILCYHGIALRDEHEWNPSLYVTPAVFRSRMERLVSERWNVIPLGEGIERMRRGDLPPRSVAITFDDGFHDFAVHAYPVLRALGLPATVYLTTHYTKKPYPIFNLISSYLLWKAGRPLDGTAAGLSGVLDGTTDAGRARAVATLNRHAAELDLSAAARDELAARLASAAGLDYSDIAGSRMLQLMTPEEVRSVSSGGIAIELHTHRHRTPVDRDLFLREIRENRAEIEAVTGTAPTHFCYPSGVYHPEFLPWLREEGVRSATTCEYGIAAPGQDPLLLPRILDSMQMADVDFDAWLCGAGAWLPRRNLRREEA
jgi:peptidoglycan/xylan/chitin deacetylase (PgdA/CDA1 family)